LTTLAVDLAARISTGSPWPDTAPGAGLEVPCFSSSVRLVSEGDEWQTVLDDLSAYLELCEQFGASQVRVFGGKIGERSREEALCLAADNLAEMAASADAADVMLLVETHDDWVHSNDLRTLIERVDSRAVGALWDVNHPHRYADEGPEQTCTTLGKWIRGTHWKDSRPSDGKQSGFEECLPGEGDLPLAEMLRCLKATGYEGYLTLEWEKRWIPELAEPEVAFPLYVQFMRDLMAQT